MLLSNKERFSEEYTEKFNADEWTASFLELGGFMGFTLAPDRYPVIDIKFGNLKNHERLAKIIRPNYEYKDGTKRLVIYGVNAVAVACRIKPFAPFRKGVIEHFEWWMSVDRKERQEVGPAYEVYREIYTTKRIISKIDPKDYLPLITRGSYIASIVEGDTRRIDHMLKSLSGECTDHDTFKIRSENIPLLIALHEVYYGSLAKVEGSMIWRLGKRDALNLLNFVSPYLQLYDPQI